MLKHYNRESPSTLYQLDRELHYKASSHLPVWLLLWFCWRTLRSIYNYVIRSCLITQCLNSNAGSCFKKSLDVFVNVPLRSLFNFSNKSYHLFISSPTMLDFCPYISRPMLFTKVLSKYKNVHIMQKKFSVLQNDKN